MGAFAIPDPPAPFEWPADLAEIVEASTRKFEASLRANLGVWAGMIGPKIAGWVQEYRADVAEAVRQAYQAGVAR
jgi:hypothetical protein